MKAGVIGRSIGGVDKLSPILDSFDPEAVTTRYGDDWEAVLDRIVKELKPRGKIRKTPRSIWPLYCQTILSAAAFINQFNDANQFFEWVDFFDRDVRARPSLPMLMDREIKGFGFALSCDFLKELGYVNFAKPDVHLHDIFTAIIRLARNADVTPYAADKVFWLIGSGDFYADPEIGSIGSYKQEFIEFAQSKLSDDK